MCNGQTTAARREVGINGRTGTRWRYGRREVDRTGREHVHAPIAEERHRYATSDRFLAEDERLVIADLPRSGNALHAIARELGRSAATISREVGRNSDPRAGKYHPFQAQRPTAVRRARSKEGKIRRGAQSGPCQALRTAFPDEPEGHLAPPGLSAADQGQRPPQTTHEGAAHEAHVDPLPAGPVHDREQHRRGKARQGGDSRPGPTGCSRGS
ncbi:helix-turn-helix domain-containing protein [Streptomyces sp. NPDC048441]|uniref:helix-turn-helix domain-containing protein n=1 Tax=Streptomyces sp. NPDC048441 TaxID=3365552 RepID=UPI00371D4792